MAERQEGNAPGPTDKILEAFFGPAVNTCKLLKDLVGASGFEPPASWSRTRRSTRLSHAPNAFSVAASCYILKLRDHATDH
jgi:hypothetical protein